MLSSTQAVGEAIMTLLSAMTEAEKSIRQCFARQLVKVLFVLSPGYASLPEPLQFVYATVVLLAEGQFDVMISAPNRQVDPNIYYPLRSELPAIMSDTSNAIQGFKDHSTRGIVLDEVLGLELSNLGRLLKVRPGVGDEHRLLQRLADNLWFRKTDYLRNERGDLVRRNALSTEEDLKAMALRTKPHTNPWLYLSPRLCAVGQDTFDGASILDAKEQAGATMQQINTMSLDRFQADVLTTKAEYERSDAILVGMNLGGQLHLSAVATLGHRET